MRRSVFAILLGALLLSSGSKVKKLTDTEKDHYQALRVWMDKYDKKAFFKLKTEEERNQWLQDKGLWDRFYDYPDWQREKILYGEVDMGWIMTILLGIGGSLLAGLVVHRGRPGVHRAGCLASILGAMALILIGRVFL